MRLGSVIPARQRQPRGATCRTERHPREPTGINDPSHNGYSARVAQWPRLALSLVVKSMREQHVQRFTGRKIQVTAAKTVRRELDGDTIADGRSLSASVDPSVLVVRVPPKPAGG